MEWSDVEQISPTEDVDLAALFDDLLRVETGLWNAVDTRLRDSDGGIPLSWYEPMRVVAATPSCRVADIADALLITMGGARKLVDRIETAGHCRRTPNPTDGRSSHITLTPTGTGLLHRLTTELHAELDSRLRRTLEPDTLHTLAAALHTLRA
jgi:DNA-binding MarR family transcriptional regulator